jgi:hypothetical protein
MSLSSVKPDRLLGYKIIKLAIVRYRLSAAAKNKQSCCRENDY